MSEIFHQNFKFLRKKNGFTQDSLANELGLTRAAVCSYEDGRAMPPYPKLRLIAELFEENIENLLEQNLEQEETTEEQSDASEHDFETALKPEQESDLTYSDLNFEYADMPLFGAPISRPKIEAEPKVPSFETSASENFYDQKAIKLIVEAAFGTYIKNAEACIKESQTSIQIPLKEKGEYLAFESGSDFPERDCVLIGRKVNSSAVMDNKQYIVVSKSSGIMYRKLYNQIRSRGVLIATPEVQGLTLQELAQNDVLECWEIVSYISQSLPNAEISLAKLSNIIQELQEELNWLRSKGC